MGTILTIPLHEDQIREIAFNISKQKNSWEVFVWLLAESELRIKKCFISPMNPLYGPTPPIVTIDISKIIDQPPRNEIIQLAELIAARSPTLQDLHWHLALRQYIYNQAKK